MIATVHQNRAGQPIVRWPERSEHVPWWRRWRRRVKIVRDYKVVDISYEGPERRKEARR